MDKKEDRIIIYGAGEYGKRLYYFLKSIGCTIHYFCQTSSDEIDYYDGVKIIDLEQLQEVSKEVIAKVLISIKDRGISRHIKGQLLNWNYTNMYIYECGEFIYQNITHGVCGGGYQCNLCGKSIEKFERGIFPRSKIFEKYHIVGGGTRNNVICPQCKCIDRVRWQYRILGKYTNIFLEKCSVLHIAPEQEISMRIRSNPLCDYYTGDIAYGKSMHIVDVTDIQFRDDFFDYIIMNHVLEHIEDEEKAISELKRVLKPEGKLILSFPICTDIDTYENSDIYTPEDRFNEYGQEDHVRLYGKDYKSRLEKYGLKVIVFSPQNECSREEIIKHGFIYDDVVMVCNLKYQI